MGRRDHTFFVVLSIFVAYLVTLQRVLIGALCCLTFLTMEPNRIMPDVDYHNDAHEENEETTGGDRKRIVRFVVVFVCVALAMLISYRYAIHTRANDWYLLQAANHTAWVLDTINHAEVEPHHIGRQHPKEVRAAIAAWLDGRDSATAEEIAEADAQPLTRWERWSYRALEARRGPAARPNGPRVYFVLRHGAATRITQISGQINRIESDGTLASDERREQLAPLQQELRQLREEQRAMRSAPGGAEQDPGRTFSFILVPECGAIEIMAIFLAAVVAFPTLWRKRFVGIIVGTPIMYAVNIFRLSVLAIVGALDQSSGRVWFNFAHEYLWQAVYIVFVVAVWLIWVEYVVKGKRS